MELAAPGDVMTRDDLRAARDWLLEQASALNQDLAAAPDVATIGEISDRQTDLTTMAGKLNIESIQLATGEARITAAHIRSAATHAKAVIDRVANIKTKLKLIGSALDFCATVLTGSGSKIVDGAVKFASDLGGADKAQ